MTTTVSPGSARAAPAPGISPGGPPILSAAPSGGSAAWATEHRDAVRALIAEAGVVLLRGLGVASAADVAAVAVGLGIEPTTERERFAPRSSYAEAVYSSSQWPPDELMCMHHELSYAAEVPGLILFGCLTAPAQGGKTEVADGQQVLRALPADLVAPFERDGWLLKRMYHEIGIPWTDAFGTEDSTRVDAYCASAGLECEWLPDGGLRTRQRRAAVVRHPRTGVPGWFNQIAFLNELTLDPVIRDYLISVYGSSGLPFNTAYGDGTPISADTVETINEVYLQATVAEPWQDGDVLVVDNLRMAHSREPYEGAREIVVIFGDPVRLENHVLPLPENASSPS
jgi:alpha-ketoglutarate-dependent taurine dioxygenase